MIPAALFLAGSALAQGVSLQDGDSVLADCMLDEGCGAFWTRQLAETMLATGYGFVPTPIVTSALGMKGMGTVVEIAADTTALGPPNELGQRWTSPPIIPRVAVGYQVGSYTYDDPYPQWAVGAHLLPPLRIGGLQVVSGGLTGSGAAPVRRWLWVGGDLDVTATRVTVPLLTTTDSLVTMEEIAAFLGEEVTCADPCTDRLVQLSSSARLGVSFEPMPLLFGWLRAGGTMFHDSLALDVDDTRWRMWVVTPSIDTGGGVRLGDRYQLAAAVTAARKPPLAATTGPHLVKVAVSMGFRFGDERYWGDAGD